METKPSAVVAIDSKYQVTLTRFMVMQTAFLTTFLLDNKKNFVLLIMSTCRLIFMSQFQRLKIGLTLCLKIIERKLSFAYRNGRNPETRKPYQEGHHGCPPQCWFLRSKVSTRKWKKIPYRLLSSNCQKCCKEVEAYA